MKFVQISTQISTQNVILYKNRCKQNNQTFINDDFYQ